MTAPECRAESQDGPHGPTWRCRRAFGHSGPHDPVAMPGVIRYLQPADTTTYLLITSAAELDLLDRALTTHGKRLWSVRFGQDVTAERAAADALRRRIGALR